MTKRKLPRPKTLAYRASKKRTPKAKKPAMAQPLRSRATLAEMEEAVEQIKAERAPKKTDSEVIRVTAFTGGEVNREAPLLTLVKAMFDAPDVPVSFADPGAEFMANVLMTLADESELAEAADNELDLGPVRERAHYRVGFRSRIAVEIARHMQAGELTS
jgi:hypothetical protein